MALQTVHRRKTSMSWLDLKLWLQEQKNLIEKSYIDNLYYIKGEPALLMRLYNSLKGVFFWLIAEPSKRVSIAFSDLKLNELNEKPQKIWRALLRDCFIHNLYQAPCERILYIDVECEDSLKRIVIELLPRGVICVLSNQNQILVCNEYKHMKDRIIKPGTQYIPPPIITKCSENLFTMLSELRSLIDINIVRALIKKISLPPEIAEAIAIQCNLKDKKLSELSNEDFTCIDSVHKNFVIYVKDYKPCIVYDHQNNPIGFYPYILPQFNSYNYKIDLYPTINEAINKYFEEEFKTLILTTISNKLKNEIESIKNAIEKINKLLMEMRNELEVLKNKLSTVENYYLELEQIHECVINNVKTLGWDYVRDCKAVIETVPSKGVYKVQVNNVVLELSVTKSFVDHYNDLRKAVAGLERSIAKAEEEKKKLSAKLGELMKELKSKEMKIKFKLSRSKEWYETYIWYTSSSGFLIIGGKDASQNMKIIRKLLEPHDVVLHADIHGASTVVIKTQGKNVDEDTVKEAAVIAACYSKAWKLKIMNIDVFWVYGSQISLSPPPGQYLPKGSYMVYGERNYIRNVDLKLAIGIKVDDKGPQVIIGPEHVLDKKTDILAYIVIIPGEKDPQNIAKNFIEYLKSKNCEEIASLLDINDFAMKLPGKSEVVKKIIKGVCA